MDILDSYSFSLRPFHSDLPLYSLCPISVKPWYLPTGPRTLLPANLPNSDLSQSYSILHTYGQLIILKYIYYYVIYNSEVMLAAFCFLKIEVILFHLESKTQEPSLPHTNFHCSSFCPLVLSRTELLLQSVHLPKTAASRFLFT